MRAVTVCQPYAELIASGVKRVENRSWEVKYRGRIYIHAGRSREWMTPRMVDGVEFEPLTGLQVERMTFGAVVALAALIYCAHIEDIRAGLFDRQFPWLKAHEHANGPWCWIFAENPVRITPPARYKGRQGLFDINPLDIDRICAEERARLAVAGD